MITIETLKNQKRFEHGRQLANQRVVAGIMDMLIAAGGMFWIHGRWGDWWYAVIWAVLYLLLKDSLPQRMSIGKRIAGVRIVDIQTLVPTSIAGAILVNLFFWGVIFLIVAGGVLFLMEERTTSDLWLDVVYPLLVIWALANFVHLFKPPRTQTLADRMARVEVLFSARMIKRLKMEHMRPEEG